SITLAAAKSLLLLLLLRPVAIAAHLPIIGCPDWHEMAPFERLPLWGLANVRVPLNDHPFYSFSLLLRRLCGVHLCRRIPGQSQSTQAGGVFIHGTPLSAILFPGRGSISRPLVLDENRYCFPTVILKSFICHCLSCKPVPVEPRRCRLTPL